MDWPANGEDIPPPAPTPPPATSSGPYETTQSSRYPYHHPVPPREDPSQGRSYRSGVDPDGVPAALRRKVRKDHLPESRERIERDEEERLRAREEEERRMFEGKQQRAWEKERAREKEYRRTQEGRTRQTETGPTRRKEEEANVKPVASGEPIIGEQFIYDSIRKKYYPFPSDCFYRDGKIHPRKKVGQAQTRSSPQWSYPNSGPSAGSETGSSEESEPEHIPFRRTTVPKERRNSTASYGRSGPAPGTREFREYYDTRGNGRGSGPPPAYYNQQGGGGPAIPQRRNSSSSYQTYHTKPRW
ncbi:uncharacterized protein JCM6883_001961 [Sporobolomyces salmoneus]|uniref:uncharacterized protein n=1 Tax=Sporobolomyces salmoneus TaxID=183962 RepID=UPI00316BFEDC